VIGTNLSGMQWAEVAVRVSPDTKPNIHYTVPRKADVTWLASNGYRKTRLPVQWELLQPMLSGTNANAATRAVIGEPGAFHPGHEAYITGVLDAHAAAGMKCIIDLHNFARYKDFVYQADGSVSGLTVPPDGLSHPYTTTGQVRERIFALAPGATLTQAHFNDFWTRAANKWKDHPGFGGYGLMNEPSNMPSPGQIVASPDGQNQDLTIWPTFAQAAVNAIRALDPANPIYVGGNMWSAAWAFGTVNPGFPLAGANLIYEVHMYLDAASNGQNFDYDTEVAKNFSVGFGDVPINPNTGMERLKFAGDWAQSKGVKLALGETGMPSDDVRWEEMFRRLLDYARSIDCEVYTWNGGTHWRIRNNGINHVPGWHQNKTLEPAVSGPMKAAAGVYGATLYDDGPGWAPSGTAITITVYARGNLSAPVSITVSSNNSGSLSKSVLTIPAGANGSDSFTFTSAANTVATLTYSSSHQVPPPRKVYSLADPAAYEATSLKDAAMAILAKYGASKWEMADGYTDFVAGAPAADGQNVRAICDSGFGSSAGNAMEMLNWINTSSGMGTMSAPVMRTVNGRKCTDHTVYDTFGFWCKKSEPMPGVQAKPKNRVPYNAQDPHFTIACISIPGSGNTGVVFQASKTEDYQVSELALSGGQPQANFRDVNGQAVTLTSSTRLASNTPAVVALTCVPGAQRLRVNSQVAASASATLGASTFTQMLMGWGYIGYYPRDGFMGNIYSVITGKGAPSTSEMGVLERYLASTAGVQL
jgi:endoglucanase